MMANDRLERQPRLLYHYSEEPSIRQFVPRQVSDGGDSPAMVWAIDEEHAVNYWLPRECPRVIYRKSPAVSAADEARFFSLSVANTVIAVESGWLERIRNVSLYEYTFDSRSFEIKARTAGYYVSYETVEPIDVRPVGDLIGCILDRQDVELRFLPELHTIREAILSSSVDYYSIIRFRNACPHTQSYRAEYPIK